MIFHCINAHEVVVSLIVDDGNKSRNHRSNFFTPEFAVMGCFTGPHQAYSQVTCIEYAGGFSKLDPIVPIFTKILNPSPLVEIVDPASDTSETREILKSFDRAPQNAVDQI